MELAYFAGFLDGEGYFGGSPHGGMRLGCTNTFLPVLVGLERAFGGKVGVHSKAGPRGTDMREWTQHKDAYHWILGRGKNNELKIALETLIPHLREKREQAELLLEVVNMPRGDPRKKDAYHKLREMKGQGYVRPKT